MMKNYLAIALNLSTSLLFLQETDSFFFQKALLRRPAAQYKLPTCSTSLTSKSRGKGSCTTVFSDTKLHSSMEDNEKRISRQQEEFLERESKNGADKVRAMSIEERTKRAMLAEAAEDRIMQFSDELDALLGEDGMPKSEDDREEVVRLCEQIKATQSQYSALVNGEESALLNALDGRD